MMSYEQLAAQFPYMRMLHLVLSGMQRIYLMKTDNRNKKTPENFWELLFLIHINKKVKLPPGISSRLSNLEIG